MVTALACFYRKVPFGHVEAGLRTGNVHNPFPEEMNRVLVGRMASLHFAPTQRLGRQPAARRPDARPRARHRQHGHRRAAVGRRARRHAGKFAAPDGKRLVLVTAHRRENFGRRRSRTSARAARRSPTAATCKPALPGAPQPERARRRAPRARRPRGDRPGRRRSTTPTWSRRCARAPDPDRLGRRAGRSAVAGQAGAGAAHDDRTARRRRPPAQPSWSAPTAHDHRRRTPTGCSTTKAAYDAMAKVENPYGDGRAAERIADLCEARSSAARS